MLKGSGHGFVTHHTDGAVRIWFAGSLSVRGSALPLSGAFSDLGFYSTQTSKDASLEGGALRGVLFAPNVGVKLTAGAVVWGQVAGAEVDLRSGSAIFGEAPNLEPSPTAPASASIARAPGGAKPGSRRFLPKDKDILVAPNPARDAATLGYWLAEPARVRILISNLSGELVLARELGFKPQGENIERFSLAGLASGLYLVQIQSTVRDISVNRQWVKLAVVR